MPTPATAGAEGWFTDGNPSAGLPATIVTADFLNMIQAELLAILAAANITPSKTSTNQVLQAIEALFNVSPSPPPGSPPPSPPPPSPPPPSPPPSPPPPSISFTLGGTQTGVGLNTLAISAIEPVNGLTGTTSWSISGLGGTTPINAGQSYSPYASGGACFVYICNSAGTVVYNSNYTSGTISPGEYVQCYVYSGNQSNTSYGCQVTIGGVSEDFWATTS